LPLPVEAFTGKVDLYHATDFTLPPTLPHTRTLLTVHDLSFTRTPETAHPRLRRYLEQVVPRSVARANHILADSVATKQDLMALYGTPAEKITVLLSGVNHKFHPIADSTAQQAVRAKYQLGDAPYIFAVGTVQPRKNYARLVRALHQIRQHGQDIHLVIAGGRGWLEDELYATIRQLDMSEFVHLIGYADDSDIPTLYSAARCSAFISLYEGFGLPILESMACGTPVVTANVSSLPEVAGDAALMVNDPTDIQQIVEQLTRPLLDSQLHTALTQRGLIQAAQFTWENSARQLLTVYNQLLSP
jgi:glycosyltransferase involved in cell wall biosynthesis